MIGFFLPPDLIDPGEDYNPDKYPKAQPPFPDPDNNDNEQEKNKKEQENNKFKQTVCSI